MEEAEQRELLIKAGLISTSEEMSAQSVFEALSKDAVSTADRKEIMMELGLMDGKSKTLIATNKCTEAELRSILTKRGYIGAQQDEMVSEILGTSIRDKSAISWDILRVKIEKATASMLKFLFLTPEGWAVLAVTAIVGATIAYAKFGDTLDNNRKKLADTKDAYDKTKSEIQSANDELKTTQQRINELNSKPSLTFVEQEEYDNLIKSNNELERQIHLLEQKEEIERKERNDSFVKTIDREKNYDPISFWKGSFSGNKYGWMSATQVWNALLSPEESVNGLSPEAAINDKEFIAKAKEVASKMQEEMSGIEYIPKPSTEDEKNVNKALDFAKDFQDKLAVILNGGHAKSDTFNRLVDNWQFDEATQELQDLGKEGKVTFDMLKEKVNDTSDTAFKGFISKLIELGVISDTTDGSLRYLVDAFNGVGKAAVNYVKSLDGNKLAEFGGEVEDATQKLNEEAKALGISSSELAKLTSAHILFNNTGLNVNDKIAVLSNLARTIASTSSEALYLIKLFRVLSSGVSESNVNTPFVKFGGTSLDPVAESIIRDSKIQITTPESAAKDLKNKYGIDSSILTADTSKDTYTPKTGTPSSKGSGGSGSTKEKKEVEAYTAEIEKFAEAQQKLADATANREAIERQIERERDPNKQLALQADLIAAYEAEQIAMHELNEERDAYIRGDAHIEGTVAALRERGFEIEFDPETNKPVVKNMEHLNELVASSVEGYDSLDEATIAYKKDTEGLIGSLSKVDGIALLRERGFEIEYDPETNRLVIKNMEHLNELVASSVEGYDSLQEATNAYIKENEELIKSVTKVNEENQKTSEGWAEIEEKQRSIHFERLSTALKSIEKEYDDYKDYIDEVNEGLDKQIKKEKGLQDILKKKFDAVNSLSEAQHDIDKSIADSRISKSYLSATEYAKIFNEEDYQAISNAVKRANSEISTLTDNFWNQVLTAYENDQAYLVESITAEYERQVELKLKEVEITKAELDYTKKQTELNNILSERNIKQLVERNGRFEFEWVADQEKVRQATEELADAKYNMEKLSNEQTQQIQLNEYDRRISELGNIQESNNKKVEDFGNTVDAVKTQVDNLKDPIASFSSAIEIFQSQGVTSLGRVVNDVISSLAKFTGNVYDKIVVPNGKEPVQVNPDGKAPKGLSAGTVVKTGGGNYLITSVDPDGSYKSTKLTGYATGTDNATTGWHRVNEKGDETYISKAGTFHNFSGGEYVFNAEQTRRLWDLSKFDFLSSGIMESIKTGFKNIVSPTQIQPVVNNYSFGDTNIHNPSDFNDFVRQFKSAIQRKTV